LAELVDFGLLALDLEALLVKEGGLGADEIADLIQLVSDVADGRVTGSRLRQDRVGCNGEGGGERDDASDHARTPVTLNMTEKQNAHSVGSRS
jgi:hypothetical protein